MGCLTIFVGLTCGAGYLCSLFVSPIPREWFVRKVSVEEAESQELEYRGISLNENPRWRTLKERMIFADEIWSFVSPPETWSGLYGRDGYCIVRLGIILECVVIAMN
jgi:hypothetical protein